MLRPLREISRSVRDPVFVHAPCRRLGGPCGRAVRVGKCDYRRHCSGRGRRSRGGRLGDGAARRDRDSPDGRVRRRRPVRASRAGRRHLYDRGDADRLSNRPVRRDRAHGRRDRESLDYVEGRRHQRNRGRHGRPNASRSDGRGLRHRPLPASDRGSPGPRPQLHRIRPAHPGGGAGIGSLRARHLGPALDQLECRDRRRRLQRPAPGESARRQRDGLLLPAVRGARVPGRAERRRRGSRPHGRRLRQRRDEIGHESAPRRRLSQPPQQDRRATTR